MTLTTMFQETSSVEVAESIPLMLSRRLAVMTLLPPPPPPAPPCPPPKTFPHPAVPRRAAPARPVPPILRKSLRLILVTPGVSLIPSLAVLIFTRPSFESHSVSREAAPNPVFYTGVWDRRMTLATPIIGQCVAKGGPPLAQSSPETSTPCIEVFHAF